MVDIHSGWALGWKRIAQGVATKPGTGAAILPRLTVLVIMGLGDMGMTA